MVGDEDGNINIYQLKKMNATPEDQVRHNYHWDLTLKDALYKFPKLPIYSKDNLRLNLL